MTLPWHRQHLDEPIDTDVVDLVGRVGGLNAQTARGPAVGLWTRLRRFDLATSTPNARPTSS